MVSPWESRWPAQASLSRKLVVYVRGVVPAYSLFFKGMLLRFIFEASYVFSSLYISFLLCLIWGLQRNWVTLYSSWLSCCLFQSLCWWEEDSQQSFHPARDCSCCRWPLTLESAGVGCLAGALMFSLHYTSATLGKCWFPCLMLGCHHMARKSVHQSCRKEVSATESCKTGKAMSSSINPLKLGWARDIFLLCFSV